MHVDQRNNAVRSGNYMYWTMYHFRSSLKGIPPFILHVLGKLFGYLSSVRNNFPAWQSREKLPDGKHGTSSILVC